MQKKSQWRRFLGRLFLIFITGYLASCTGGSELRIEKLAGATAGGDYLSAIASIKRDAKKLYGKTNALLFYMDVGMLYHYAGMYDSSNVYLLNASRTFEDLFAHSVTNEAASFMLNDNVRPYRSRPYELVLLHQVIALNYLALGNVDEALVESRATQLLMNELERKDKNGAKYSTDGMFHYISSIAYDAAGKPDDAMISLFQSVQAFEKGPVALPAPVKTYAYYMLQLNNRTEDVKQLNISVDTSRPKPAGLSNGETEVVFVGYAGRGPVLAEDRWWGTYIRGGLLLMNHTGATGAVETMQLPAPPLPEKEYDKAAKGKSNSVGTTFHVSFSLPAVKRLASQTSFFTVSQAGAAGATASTTTAVINDLDVQAQKNLDDTRGATLARTAVRVVLRTIAAEKAKSEMQTQNPIANLLIGLTTDVLADQLEHADIRSCFLVPKTVQIARIPVKPGKYTFEAKACNAAGSAIGTKMFENVEVKQGEKKFLFYSSFK